MFKPNRIHHLSAMKQLSIKALYLLVAISLAISGLTAPTVTDLSPF